MKCPGCGAELSGQEACDKCGAKPENKIEVAYKDFRISELLEIKHIKVKPHTAQKEKERSVAGNSVSAPGKKIHSGAAEKTGGKKGLLKKAYRKESPPYPEKKYLINSVVIVLILLAIIAGVIFVWRFLS